MASQDCIREYLAYWFQLGKAVWVEKSQTRCQPTPIFQGNRYSDQFEACWQLIMAANGEDCYLEGTDETIADLLGPQWEITACARCEMPVPMSTAGRPPQSSACPCADLSSWPNNDIPKPRSAVDTDSRLGSIRDRLNQLRGLSDHLQEDMQSGEAAPSPKSLADWLRPAPPYGATKSATSGRTTS